MAEGSERAEGGVGWDERAVECQDGELDEGERDDVEGPVDEPCYQSAGNCS